MPELPEVETVVRGLQDTVLGRTFSKIQLFAPTKSIILSSSIKPSKLDLALQNKKILNIKRRGKNILIELSGELTLWIHLKMTGHLYFKKKSDPVEKHDLVLFDFKAQAKTKTNNNYHLRFNDYRRFGRLRLFKNGELWNQKGLKELGPEPLEISKDDFVNLFKKSKRMTKPAILDQSFIAGIGNIYADEALFASKINPKRITSSISIKKLKELHGHIQRILKLAIKNMGSSVDTYAGVDGNPGGFQKYLKAYGNEGKPCHHCGRKIVREKIGSRSAHYCPRCQKL
jgi:formamidopyrimidine-DNA glycosylase